MRNLERKRGCQVNRYEPIRMDANSAQERVHRAIDLPRARQLQN